MSDGTPLVDVIVPTYERAEFTAQAVESIQAQTLTSWRLILVDDASSSACVARLTELARSDDRINLVRLDRNGGQQVARQSGLERSSAPYIALLDSDDLWLPTKLERQLELAERLPEGDAILCWHRWQQADGSNLPVRRPHRNAPERLTSSNLSTILVPRKTLLEAGGFLPPGREPARNWHGIDLYLRLSDVCEFGVVEELLTICRVHAGARTSNTLATERAAKELAYILDSNATVLEERPLLRAHLLARLTTRWAALGSSREAFRVLRASLRGLGAFDVVRLLRRFAPTLLRTVWPRRR